MKKIDACKLRRKGGFTLVELIVVLVLLSVLSAVAVPTYLGYVDDNKAKQCETHRKTLASRLEEMSAMGSNIELTDEMINSDENGCPAGGTYTLSGTADGSTINSKTITCDKHGSTTAMLKNNSQVTAKSSTETEKKAEKEPEKTETNPPVKPTPVLSISITPNPVAMEKEQTQSLTANVVSKEHCEISSYEWRSDKDSIVSVSGSGQTATITAVNEGTCTIFCKAKATASAEAGGQSFDSTEASVQVTVNPAPSLSISLVEGQASAYTLGVGATQELDVIPNEIRCKNTSYSWSVTGGGGTAHIEGSNENAAVTIKADQAGECTLTCQATAISDVDNSTVISSSNEVTVNIKVASLSITVDTSSVSDEVEIGSPISLEALPTPRNCTVSKYNWWLEDGGKGVLNITEGGTAQTVVINAQTDGSCKVYCQAFAKPDGSEQEISSNTVEIPVSVKKEEKETGNLLKDAPNPILINACTNGNGVVGKVAGIYDRLRALENIKGGLWASSDTSVADFLCHTLNDQPWNLHMNVYRAGTFELTYTVDGQSETINAKVVYPHTDFQIKGYNGLTGENAARVGDTVILTAKINGDNSTDGPLNWVNDTPALIDISDISKEEKNTFVVKAKTLAAGTVTLHVSLLNEFTGEISVEDISFDVTDTPRSARQVEVGGGAKFDLSEWNVLCDAIKEGKVNELPLANLYYYTQGEANNIPIEDGSVIVYMRVKDKSLSWDGCNDDMTFKEYLDLNPDSFIPVKMNQYYIASFGNMTVPVGNVIKNSDGSRYFVCIKAFAGNPSNFTEEQLSEYFVEIPIAA